MRKLIIVIATVLLAALAGGVALGADSYVDPAGDSGAAPDITEVTAANDLAGNITLTVRTNQAAVAADSAVSVVLDSDSDLATGTEGFEYVFTIGSAGWRLLRWDGAQFVPAPAPSANGSYSSGVATFKVHRSDLQIGTNFRFFAFTLQLDAATGKVAAGDAAPDSNIPYTYILSTPFVLRAGAPASVPAKPAAGKPFQVRVRVTQGTNGTPVTNGSATCRVTVAGKPLRAAARVVNGFATCTMRLPIAARGKILRGSITVTVEQTSVSKPFSYRVR